MATSVQFLDQECGELSQKFKHVVVLCPAPKSAPGNSFTRTFKPIWSASVGVLFEDACREALRPTAQSHQAHAPRPLRKAFPECRAAVRTIVRKPLDQAFRECSPLFFLGLFGRQLSGGAQARRSANPLTCTSQSVQCLLFGNRFDQQNNLMPCFLIFDPAVASQHAGRCRVKITEYAGRIIIKVAGFVKISDRHFKNDGDLLQPRRRHSVCAFFIIFGFAES